MELVLDSQSCAWRGLTGRVIIAIVTRRHWYKTGVFTVTRDTAVQIGETILSPTARSRG